NAGKSTDAAPTDQRGLPRIALGQIDIGSVERQPVEIQAGTPVPTATNALSNPPSLAAVPVNVIATRKTIADATYGPRAVHLGFGRTLRLRPSQPIESARKV